MALALTHPPPLHRACRWWSLTPSPTVHRLGQYAHGTASGDLTTPGGVVENNSQFTYNDLNQNFTVGSFFDVFVTLSGPRSALALGNFHRHGIHIDDL